MSFDVVVKAEGLSKSYAIFEQPQDRLKQMILPKLQRAVGFAPHKYYRQFWALKDVSFQVRKGETLGVVGINGSGKSTLLQMISGTLTPTGGSITCSGRLAAILELGAGFNPEFTGRENAILNAQILGLSRQEIDGKIDKIEEFADIGEFFERPVKTYSSGMYVRVAFAVQAMVDPEILIIDEALAVGDAAFQAKCMARINGLKADGASIVFVSHDVASVRQLCDRAIWLHKGMVAMQGNTMQVTANYIRHVFSEGEEMVAPNGVEFDPGSLQRAAGAPIASELDKGASLVSIWNDHAATKPVSRWGSDVGCLLRCELQDIEGNQTDVVTDQMPLRVVIRFRTPVNARLDGLGVAFAFRSLKGLDIFVSNTFDRKAVMFTISPGLFDVVFEFKNCLNSGEYMLVGVIEDRSDWPPRYYDFFEGAKYFKVVQSECYFGQCVFPIKQSCRELQSCRGE